VTVCEPNKRLLLRFVSVHFTRSDAFTIAVVSPRYPGASALPGSVYAVGEAHTTKRISGLIERSCCTEFVFSWR